MKKIMILIMAFFLFIFFIQIQEVQAKVVFAVMIKKIGPLPLCP